MGTFSGFKMVQEECWNTAEMLLLAVSAASDVLRLLIEQIFLHTGFDFEKKCFNTYSKSSAYSSSADKRWLNGQSYLI